MKLLPALLVLLLALPSLAQSDRKVTIIDFKNDVIEGTLSTPDVEVTRGTRSFAHDSLVKVRKDFRPRILGSVGRL